MTGSAHTGKYGGDLQATIDAALAALGPATLSGMSGRSVLIKANFNSPDRYPASSAPDFLEALTHVLRRSGAGPIRLGDSCGLRWAPAEHVAAQLGIPALADRLGIEWVNFDAGPWRDVPVRGRHFPVVRIAEAAFAADRIVYACCIKTHRLAGFSASLKHAVGFLPPEQRAVLHQGELMAKIAEINLAVRPHLILADARKCLVTGGPSRGWIRRPGVILASTDRIELDTAALSILGNYWALNRLTRNPADEPQLREARTLGLDRLEAFPDQGRT